MRSLWRTSSESRGPHDPPSAEHGGPGTLGADRTRRALLRQSLSVAVATALYGISFGALATVSGLTVLQACALSALLFAGGSQFALIGVLGAGGTGFAAVTSSALLGIRCSLYGLQLAPILAPRGLKRLAAAHLTIDESTAVSVAQTDPRSRRRGFWWTGIALYLGWNAMTLAGAVLGDALGDPRRYGLDGAAAAGFLALLWPRLKQGRSAAVAAAGAVVAAALSPVLPVGLPIVAAAVIAVAVGLSRSHEPATGGSARGRVIGAEATRERA
jgi:predicted branched-subunit amino acid permease